MVYTVIRFVSISAKFGTCTVVSANGTLVEAKMCTFTLECTGMEACSLLSVDISSFFFNLPLISASVYMKYRRLLLRGEVYIC